MIYDSWQVLFQLSVSVPGKLVKGATVRNRVMFGTGQITVYDVNMTENFECLVALLTISLYLVVIDLELCISIYFDL